MAVPLEEQAQRVLDDEALLLLARMAATIEGHYGSPQDVEFAWEDGRAWIVQSRPITTLGDEVPGEEPGTVLRVEPPNACQVRVPR